MPSPQSTVTANAETVGTAIGRMAIGLGIGAAGVGIGIGIAVGLYYVGRGLERAGSSHHMQYESLGSPPSPPPKASK
jgi:hypothetical protein